MGLTTEIKSGGAFFKATDHTTDLALLVEPKAWRHNATNTYKGEVKPRDEVTADITVFANQDQLDGKAEPTVLKDAVLTNTALTSIGKENIGESLPVVLRKPSGKDYWSFEVVSGDTLEKVVAYYEKREADLAAAMAEAPSFDD